MERLACEFNLIRYVPDVVKGEFVNIGVVLREAGAGSPAEVRFTRDWARVRCVDAGADVEMLENLEQEIGQRLRTGVSAKDPKGVLEVLEDSLSNSLDISEARGTLAENMTTELEQLMRMYVEPLKVPRVRQKSGRGLLVGAMRTEFERAGVWGLMEKRIAASQYTQTGDPLRIDCGYRKASGSEGARVRMFHAVSLDSDVLGAKGLALSAPQLEAGVRRVYEASLQLTAVVEPRLDEDEAGQEWLELYDYGVDTMERHGIRVLPMSRLVAAAATAARELGI
jgi:hypothetical protein